MLYKSEPDFQNKNNKIRFFFYLGALFPILLCISIFTIIFLNTVEEEHQDRIKQLSNVVLSEKKVFLRNSVERTIYMIEHLREDARKNNILDKLSNEQIDDITKKKVSSMIRDLRLTKNKDYIWVNHIINYAGGDNYAIREIHPNLPETEGIWLSTKTKDSMGNTPYQIELDGINKNGELYYDYYFKKIDSDITSHKLSFAKLYKPFDWVIASGIYLDEFDLYINSERNKMEKIYNQQEYLSAAIMIVVILFSIIIIVLFEKHISQLISSQEKEIILYTNKLEILSRTDKLTDLYNRLMLDEVFVRELDEANRYHKAFSIIIIDIDQFKNVNDTYGHQAGDSVLKQLAKILQKNTRSVDTVGRWGGEEFLIISPETDINGARQLAENIRKIIENHHFPIDRKMTCSFGVACYQTNDSKEKIVERADVALYQAKSLGRNRVEVS